MSTILKIVFAAVGFFSLTTKMPEVQAFELDWAGQFRVENHTLINYTMDPNQLTPDPARQGAGGYYIPGGGAQHSNFQTLFARFNPTVTVNDNFYIRSEWWLGDPVFGLFGNGTPATSDQRQWLSSSSRGSPINVQRLWADIVTDIGVVLVIGGLVYIYDNI
jgi:hypothetical protein